MNCLTQLRIFSPYSGGECHVGSDYWDSGDCRRPSGSGTKGFKGRIRDLSGGGSGSGDLFLWHHEIKYRDRDHPPGSELYPAEPDVSGGPVKNDRNYLYCGIFIWNL